MFTNFFPHGVEFYVWPRRVACGILGPQPGMEPAPFTLEAWSLNHWTAREYNFFLNISFKRELTF